MWLLLTLFAVISFAIARISQKSLLNDEKLDSITYAIYFQILVALIILPFAVVSGFYIPPLGSIWTNLIIMILLYGFANIFSYLSIKRIPISEFIIIVATTPIWTALTSIPLLGESANLLKIIGIMLTVLGIVFVFYTGNKLQFNNGHIFALLAALFFGLAFTNDAFLLKSFNSTTYSMVYFLLPALFIASVYPKKIKGFKLLFDKKKVFLTSTFLYAMAALAVNTSYKLGGEISQISAMLQLNSIVTIFLGILFLKEKENLTRKIIGGAIVVLGAILVGMK